MKFRLDVGDEILKKDIDTCERNATLLSWIVRNVIISRIKKIMKDKFLAAANQSVMFTVIADVTTDCSIKDQLVPLIRHVDTGKYS